MTPCLAVVVPTRNRAAHAEQCVRSILATPAHSLEVVVVDQSDDDATVVAVTPFLDDRRFRLIRSASRGASNARNAGIEQSTAPIIAFTDDDCRVSPDWAGAILTIFAGDHEAAIVFGRVSIPEQVRVPGGFGADFEPTAREYQSYLPSVDVPWGIGANMSIRRTLVERIGFFDPMLGPGARFRAGEECDLMIRALTSGAKVVNAAEAEVWHLGVRTGREAAALSRGYGLAMGATLMKHLRLGTCSSVPLFVSWVAHFGWLGLRNAVRGRRPSGLGLVGGMLRGACQAIFQPLDRTRGVYGSPLG